MKNIFVLFSFFVSFHVVAQSSYILTRSGGKIDFAKNSVQVVVLDKVVSYRTLGGANKEIAFKEIDEAFFGTYRFKSFNFVENKNNYCYFVLAESPQASLIVIGIPDADEVDESISARVKYEMFVLNKSNKVVEALVFSNIKNEKGFKARSQVRDFIRRNFENCEEVMNRFEDYERSNEPQLMGILGFFTQPTFVKCD